ncbi:MAG: DUF3667 domain-containing protein [Thermomonas sp.]|uniref:DUF3667 domain-containing protein n=1 Tax=Thermomonas sp. TaxID=1971895 RepID=UPI00260D047D|nr:DUF3667 domain-containing protein [Thermomonas sp.]MCC7096934.1 DUF3667 domain-containing protein [Thermomonas sp.]
MQTEAESTPAPTAEPQPRCRNCNEVLHGPHCHACGQPVKGLMRPLGSVLGDLLDSVFDFDARIVRTLLPLYLRPGFLSVEYFAGRQVRYVTPFRLFFFLAVLAFFVARMTVQVGGPDKNAGMQDAFAQVSTVAAVVKLRDEQLAQLEQSRRDMAGSASAIGAAGIQVAEQHIRDAADARIRALQGNRAGAASPSRSAPEHEPAVVVGGKPWDATKNPIAIAWLPGFANRWLNAQAQRGSDNVARLERDPGAFKDAVLSVIPTALFVLVPVFALLLKLAYLFKRRLYMEHLVVALHSHAFLCLSLLLILLATVPASTFAPDGTWLNTLFGGVIALLLAWTLVYLLRMQKRVYAQGWPMTLLKFGALGAVYTMLLGVAVTASALVGLVEM